MNEPTVIGQRSHPSCLSQGALREEDLYAMIANDLFGAFVPRRDDRVGVELELFPLLRDSGGNLAPVPLRSAGDGASLARLLERFASSNGWEWVDDASGAITVLRAGGGCLTLEPAGQIEYSGPALASPAAALDDLVATVALLREAAGAMGIELMSRGYSGLHAADALPLQVRKPRYTAMDSYFDSIGPFGRQMMRATCSLQINLDFGSAAASDRWRLANMIAPSLNAIFANAPHVHNGLRYRSFRHEIWRRLDPSRTGRLYDRPDLDPVADYLRFALDARVMLIRMADGTFLPPPEPVSFREWMRRGGPFTCDMDAWRLHLTTLFPDVRPRGWMELRSVDALPEEWWGVPLAIASTLIYTDGLRAAALERIENRTRRRGWMEYEHDGYWRSDFETGVELLHMAIPSIEDPRLASIADEYHRRFASRGLTPGG
ncbi:MAG: gshA [Chlorobi bacterium]|nr:gshA [Chlorobiota bacterium]